jgi:putative peptide zinc metalloprotease protein
MGRAAGRSTWRATEGRPVRRGLALALALAQRAGRARAWWPDEPQLAMVLVPADAAPQGAAGALEAPAESPTWVFPFNKPDAPLEGDNQALAVNTTDGSIRYDVAFALVWADDGEVLNANEAYAFASCTGCAAVAIGFQVILVLGQADVVVPQNIAAAVNYNCLACATYALAKQLVLTLDGPLSDAGMAAIEAVWAQIQQFGSTIADVPASQIQSTLEGFEQQIKDIVQAESAGETPTASPPPAAPSDSPSGAAEDGATPSDEPSASSTPEVTPSPAPTGDGTTAAPTSGPTDTAASAAVTAP